MISNINRRGGPYASKIAQLGGLPTVGVDVPICAVFVFLYLCSAITNITIFRLNRSRGHKFFVQCLLIGFSMARVGTYVLRIAWATRPHNIRLAIAAGIFQNAGVLVIYILNIILAQRILRAKQPRIGWNPILRIVYKILYILIGLTLCAVIATTVLSVYTLNTHTLSICRDILLAAITFFLVIACFPMLLILVALLLPRSKIEETFGEGSMKSKIIIVTISTLLVMIMAGFKDGANWSPPHLISHPAWYQSKAAFYVFNPTLEIITLIFLTAVRIDKRFFVPNGSNQPGDYTRLGRLADDMSRKGEEDMEI